jgi:hypothetical protein
MGTIQKDPDSEIKLKLMIWINLPQNVQKRPSLQKGDDSGSIIRLMLCLQSSFPKPEMNDTFMLQTLHTCHVKMAMKL